MIKNLIRSYVEGVGSKTLAFIGAGLVVAFLAPVLYAKFGIDPSTTFDFTVGAFIAIIAGVAKMWHVDIKTEGKSTTSALMTLQALQTAEKLLPDGTKADAIVKQVLEALKKEQAAQEAGGAAVPSQAPSPME